MTFSRNRIFVAAGLAAGLIIGVAGHGAKSFLVHAAEPLQNKATAPPPPKPVDPNHQAGVRGPGISVIVRVEHKGKPVTGAHVVIKNRDGSVAGSGDTTDTGDCTLNLGAGNYSFTATQMGRTTTKKAEISGANASPVVDLRL